MLGRRKGRDEDICDEDVCAGFERAAGLKRWGVWVEDFERSVGLLFEMGRVNVVLGKHS